MDRLLFETQKPVTLEAVRELRHLLEPVVQATVPDLSIQHRILLCLSEAVTNLVLHAAPKANLVTMCFGLNSYGWWLELLDDGASWDPSQYKPIHTQNHFELSEHGRGTSLLHTQCERMEYYSGDTEKTNQLRMIWATPKKHRRPTILIVEDDAPLRRVYAAYLTEDFELHMASNGHEALQQLNTNKIDLVLSDINMPQMSGFSLRKNLKQASGTNIMPFIFLTAFNDTHMQKQAASLGIDDYLVKPVDKTQLVHTINRVLGRSQQIYRHLTDRIDKNITSSLAPKLPDKSHGWRLCFANRHTGIGGGDLLLHRSSEEQLVLVLIDIMGHDDCAKFFAYAYGGYLRGLMHSSATDISPSQLLEKLSESALQDELLSQVTLTSCVATLSPGGKITLASAGHPPPLIISKNGAEAIPIGGILPGLLPATTYQTKSIHLENGERVALYTDGLFESAEDNDTRKKLEARITTALTDTLNSPIEQSIQTAMDVFDELAGTPPKDDTLLLLMEKIKPCPI